MLGGSGAQIGTDTLSVAWLRGGYRHVDAASWLLLVDTKSGHDAAFGFGFALHHPDLSLVCRHQCTSALTRNLACTLRLLLVRSGDHSCVSIFSPLPNSDIHSPTAVA